tara:strand:- start:172 stop:771 length:600 start_codon:yes stop_codon:yes gene_type:complete
MKFKFILNLTTLIIFFTWGIFTVKSSIFPYEFLVMIKKNTYDFFYKIEKKKEKPTNTIIFKKIQKQHPNFYNKKRYITKYSNEKNIWSDRIYYNHKNDEKLLNFYLIEINRHQQKDINIHVDENVIIYRPICEANNNLNYKSWEKVNFEIMIIGQTCVHQKIVKKSFKKGSINLNSGGPVASDPIFIEGLSSLEKIFIK